MAFFLTTKHFPLFFCKICNFSLFLPPKAPFQSKTRQKKAFRQCSFRQTGIWVLKVIFHILSHSTHEIPCKDTKKITECLIFLVFSRITKVLDRTIWFIHSKAIIPILFYTGKHIRTQHIIEETDAYIMKATKQSP